MAVTTTVSHCRVKLNFHVTLTAHSVKEGAVWDYYLWPCIHPQRPEKGEDGGNFDYTKKSSSKRPRIVYQKSLGVHLNMPLLACT